MEGSLCRKFCFLQGQGCLQWLSKDAEDILSHKILGSLHSLVQDIKERPGFLSTVYTLNICSYKVCIIESKKYQQCTDLLTYNIFSCCGITMLRKCSTFLLHVCITFASKKKKLPILIWLAPHQGCTIPKVVILRSIYMHEAPWGPEQMVSQTVYCQQSRFPSPALNSWIANVYISSQLQNIKLY